MPCGRCGEADLDIAARSRRSFAPEVFERLRRLQRRYDPTGLFHRPGFAAEPLRKAG